WLQPCKLILFNFEALLSTSVGSNASEYILSQNDRFKNSKCLHLDNMTDNVIFVIFDFEKSIVFKFKPIVLTNDLIASSVAFDSDNTMHCKRSHGTSLRAFRALSVTFGESPQINFFKRLPPRLAYVRIV